MDMNKHIPALAKQFSFTLMSWIGKKKMAQVVKRNNWITYKDACASHDFCDANMAMDEAFQMVTSRKFQFGNPSDTALWNKAWAMAKRNNFYFIKIKEKGHEEEAITC